MGGNSPDKADKPNETNNANKTNKANKPNEANGDPRAAVLGSLIEEKLDSIFANADH